MFVKGSWIICRLELGQEASFRFGQQGSDYVDLGRFRKFFLMVGLVL